MFRTRVSMRRPGKTGAALTIFALTLLASGPLAGCKGLQRRQTGYLSDYSKLEKESEGRLMYVNPRIEPGTYQRFIVDPVALHLAEDHEGDFTAEELEELAEYFYNKIVEHISTRRQVVTRPGPGVARLRVAVTDIETSTALLNIIPHTRLTGVGRGGGAFEGELVDSTTGEQIAAVVRKTKGGGVFSGGGMSKMSDAKRAIDKWVDDLQDRIDEWRVFAAQP